MSAAPNQAPQADPINATGQDAFLLVEGRDEGVVSIGEAAAQVVDRLRPSFPPAVTLLVDFSHRERPIAELIDEIGGTPHFWGLRVGTAPGQSIHFIGYSREHAERITAAFNWRPEVV
jgi:hypothetical protein